MKLTFSIKIVLSVILLVSSLFVFRTAKAQQTEQQQSNQKQILPAKKTAISFTPTYIFRSTLQIGVQRFNKYQDRSFNLYGAVTGLNNDFLSENGFAAEAQYRLYVKRFKVRTNLNEKVYQQGIYVGFWARGEVFEGKYAYQDIDFFTPQGNIEFITYKGTRNVEALSGGIQFGFQQTFAEYFFIDLYIGGGYRAANTDTQTDIQNTQEIRHQDVMRWHNGVFDRAFEGVLPRAGVSLGVLF